MPSRAGQIAEGLDSIRSELDSKLGVLTKEDLPGIVADLGATLDDVDSGDTALEWLLAADQLPNVIRIVGDIVGAAQQQGGEVNDQLNDIIAKLKKDE